MAFTHPLGAVPGLMGANFQMPTAGQAPGAFRGPISPFQGAQAPGGGSGQHPGFGQLLQNLQQRFAGHPQADQIIQMIMNRVGQMGMGIGQGAPGGATGAPGMQGLFGQMPTNFQFPGMTPNTGA